jgi:creatinine amidohydrolase
MIRILCALAILLAPSWHTSGKHAQSSPSAKGALLEDLTWMEAEKILTRQSIVVIPLGAAAKEHGPHLTLKNDWLIAEYLKKRVLEKSNVVIAPTINYGFYPAFVEYPGSTTLRLETARDFFIDVCRGLARFGPKRFYILNTGISTIRALAPAAEVLRAEGILMRYTALNVIDPIEKQVRKEEGGTHADEIETSMMLYMAPESVNMAKAVKDYHPSEGQGGLTRSPKGQGVYSPTGVWGDATLATRAKGKIVVEALVAAILREIEELRHSPVPAIVRLGFE